MDAIDSWSHYFTVWVLYTPRWSADFIFTMNGIPKKIYKGNDLPLQKKTINLSFISFQFTSSVIR